MNAGMVIARPHKMSALNSKDMAALKIPSWRCNKNALRSMED